MTTDGGCDVWQGAKTSAGYGILRAGSGSPQYAHRLVWMQDNGPIPPGHYICHTCDNPSCIRLDHLFLGTPGDNARDMLAKGRQFSPHRGRELCERGHNDWRTRPDGYRECHTCVLESRRAKYEIENAKRRERRYLARKATDAA